MQCNLPSLKWWLDRPACNILENILRSSPLCVLGVDNLTASVNFDDVRIYRINLFKRARLAKDA